jgi:hypothetical protein
LKFGFHLLVTWPKWAPVLNRSSNFTLFIVSL